LQVEKPWKSTALQSVITLQWTLFLVEAFRFNRNLEQDTRLTEETVEGMVGSAIRGDAFKFLNEKLVGLNKESSSKAGEEAGRGANGGGAGLKEDLSVSMLGGPSQGRPGAAGVMGAAAGSKEKGEELVDASFKWHILTQVDFLIANFVTTMSPILRKLKHREEDVVLESSHSSSRSTRNNPATNASSSAPAPTPRADIEALFLLIAAVYRDSPPDAGLKYWHDADGRLFAFLRWAADARTPEMVKALFEMLSSLSVGPQSSTFAFNFLSSGGGDQYSSGSVNSGSTVCSWSSLFNALNFYSNQLPKVNEALQSSIQPGLPTQRPRRDANSPSTIPPDELALLKSFLRLLKNVVQSSPIARTALYENQHFKAIPTLLSLVNSIVPIEFKAALFDTLTAFCGPEGGSLGVDIAKQMWTALDKFEVIPSKGSSSSNGLYRSSTTASRPGSTGGIMAELEEAEATARTYPATIAFVHLLNSLIHTPAKSITLLHGVEVESHTIPESLGAGSRTPGIIPYVRFVLEDVFLKARTLQFADPKERWRLTERSLCFIEKCLATYDLSPLLNEKPDNSILASLALHPAFEILRRLLTEAPLLTNLLDIVSVGLDGLTDDAGQTPALAKSILRSLRIMNRIFQIQSLYIEVLLPTLAESQTFSGANRSFSFAIAPLDQHILYSHSVVVQIALLVNYIDDPETVLLAVKLIGHLSQSPFFIQMDRFENVYSSNMNRLVGIIDSSDESLRILDGFVRRLEADGQNDLDWPEDDPIESLVTSDARTTPSADLVQVIRSAILDLLLQNTVAGSSGPNLAHFLCGFDPTRAASELAVQDPQGQGARLSCLHIVFELLSLGAPRPTEDEDEELAEEALLMRNPGLAEKCAKLVFQLCSHQYTASATLRYIRTREDYAYRQISVFPTVPPSISQGALGEVNLTNGQKIVTSASALTSSLRFRSSILDNAALELHVINPTGLHAAKLVDALFTSPLTMLDHFESHVHDSGSADQPLIRIIDVLLSLDFEWQDDIPDTDLKLAFFASLDFNTCLTVNERGCEIYDFRSLVSAMNGVRRQLQKMGALSNSAQQEAIKLETRGVLLALAAENHRREISQAKHQCLISWQRVLDVVLFKSFELIPLEQRESMIFDLLSSVLRFVAAPDTTPAAAEIFCQVVLSLITKLRQGRREQILFSDGDELAGSLPADKLHTLLRQVLDAITQSGTTEFIRGNLYTVIINYLQLIASFTPSSEGSLKPELDTSKVLDDTAFVAGSTTSFRTGPRSSTLDGGTLAIFLSVIDKLAPILCRDALDGSEIWKTVAYTTLETLVTASKEDRSHRLLSVLAKTGYLRSFVQSLKDSENDLLGIMTPDPGTSPAFLCLLMVFFLSC
jgi:nuclear pore complex protein Nup205